MSLPYFPMFPSDFEAKTSHLTMAEDGAYNRLLRICWMTPGCSIPADEAWIMRRVRATDEASQEAVRAVLAEFFTKENGRYSNAKLTRIWSEANEAHDKRKNAGAKGGKAKALKRNNTDSSNAKAKLKQPEPEPEPDIREEPYGSLSSGDDAVRRANVLSEAVDAYNSAAERCGWPECQKLTKPRASALAARLKEACGLDGWLVALGKAEASDFLCGRRETTRGPFFASFDFLTRQSSFAKLMEGTYDNRASRQQPNHAHRPEDRSDPALANILRLTGLSQAPGGSCH